MGGIYEDSLFGAGSKLLVAIGQKCDCFTLKSDSQAKDTANLRLRVWLQSSDTTETWLRWLRVCQTATRSKPDEPDV